MSRFATFHDFKDASVFITGGGAGIGASLTEGFLSQGCKVAFVQRSDESQFVKDIDDKYGHAPKFIPCDITDVAALQKAMDIGAEANGVVFAVVNNAANDTRHELEGFSVEAFDQSMAVNLRPHFFTAQAAAPAMKKNGGGSIINFYSISYMMGNMGYPAYAGSKSAITGLTRSLARELGPDNIRINALMPGWVMTQRQKDLWVTEEGLEQHLSRQCLKNLLSPSDIVDATLFLTSRASQMMTGQAMVIDGGVVVTG